MAGALPTNQEDTLIAYRACYYALRGALLDHIEAWEIDAEDADAAAETYDRRDEARVELHRQANRSRALARELREILDSVSSSGRAG